MPFSLNPEIDKVNMALDLLAAKQESIGSNIANVNTPGYVRQDISFEAYLGKVNSPLETKLAKKMGPGPALDENEEKVNISQELVAMQKNSLFFAVTTRRASSLMQELKTVAQVGK